MNSGKDGKMNRYTRLMNEVIRPGVKTKVLMLSATPVNNRFNDLKNQLALAYEGNTAEIDSKLKAKNSINEIFRRAQKAFNQWSKLPEEERTTDRLLHMLDFDFFELLDSVTIAARGNISRNTTTPQTSAPSPRAWRPSPRRQPSPTCPAPSPTTKSTPASSH